MKLPNIFIFIFIFSLSANASPSICDQALDLRKLDFPDINLTRKCELQWKERGEATGLQLFIAHKGCKKLEGGSLQTCGFVQSCDKDLTELDLSAGIFLDAEFHQQVCGDNNFRKLILGHPSEIPHKNYKVFLVCKHQKIDHVLLQSPKGRQKACKIN